MLLNYSTDERRVTFEFTTTQESEEDILKMIQLILLYKDFKSIEATVTDSQGNRYTLRAAK